VTTYFDPDLRIIRRLLHISMNIDCERKKNAKRENNTTWPTVYNVVSDLRLYKSKKK